MNTGDATEMPAVTMTVLIALLSGGFGLLGVWLGGRSSLRQAKYLFAQQTALQNRKDTLARLEELHALVDRWGSALIVHHATLRRIMGGDLTYDQAHALIIQSKTEGFDAVRMNTLGELYFPEARPAYHAIVVARDRASDIQARYKAEYQQVGPQAQSRSMELTATMEELDGAVARYKSALVECVRNV